MCSIMFRRNRKSVFHPLAATAAPIIVDEEFAVVPALLGCFRLILVLALFQVPCCRCRLVVIGGGNQIVVVVGAAFVVVVVNRSAVR